jgi:hypothetical protein
LPDSPTEPKIGANQQRESLIQFLTKHFRDKQRIQRQLETARRQGQGLKVSEWTSSEPEAPGDLVASLIEWCKEALAGSRRPYGVDHFDLVLAVRNEDSVRNLTFSQLHIRQLYEDDLAHQLLALINREVGQAGSAAVHLAAGLFSWGDALHAALINESAAAN